MSFLEFDGDENSLCFFDDKGKMIGGPWQASNRGGPESDRRLRPDEAFVTFLPNGDYEFEHDCQHAPRRHSDHPEDDTLNGKYGTHGTLVLKDIYFGGHQHTGVAVHAGRATVPDSTIISKKPEQQSHLRGAFHRTNGCIRTTEEAMRAIVAKIPKDPLKKLRVKNNGNRPIAKAKDEASPAREQRTR